jgi:hypothetical protein
VGGAGGAADVLVHEGAAEVVDAGVEELAGAVLAELDPGRLDVVEHPSYAIRATACMRTDSRQVGPRRAPRLR